MLPNETLHGDSRPYCQLISSGIIVNSVLFLRSAIFKMAAVGHIGFIKLGAENVQLIIPLGQNMLKSTIFRQKLPF